MMELKTKDNPTQDISYSNPIFIGGLDRTGKTLMRLMLTSHSEIAITRRTYMWSKYYQKFGNLEEIENFDTCLRVMLASKTIRFLGPDEEAIRKEFSQGEATYARLFSIIQMQFARDTGKSRWGDQMGMIEQYADAIISAYPNAKIIHMIRDPRERYEEKFRNNKPKPGKLGWETERWLKSVRFSERNILHYPRNYYILAYEELISDPEITMRKICDFIEEPYEAGMISMENAIRFGDKPIELSNYLQELKSDELPTLWNNFFILSRGEVAYIQASAHQEMLNSGYSMNDIQLSVMDKLKYVFIDWPINSVGGLMFKYSVSKPGIS